jgi:hypothetical protein
MVTKTTKAEPAPGPAVDEALERPREGAEVRTEPPPGWSNGDTTPVVFPQSPGVDMSVPGFSNNGPASTGATAGAPGAWTPANSDPPNKFQSMDTITASPATAWTVGQYVTLGDGSLAHWAGAAWASGKA